MFVNWWNKTDTKWNTGKIDKCSVTAIVSLNLKILRRLLVYFCYYYIQIRNKIIFKDRKEFFIMNTT